MPKVPLPSRIRERDQVAWRKSLPLFRAAGGVLFHRVASVTTFLDEEFGRQHDALHYLCGNIGHVRKYSEFTDNPSDDAVICARCEALARLKGLPSIDELIGRHCHVGGVKSFRTCCEEER